MILVCTSLPGSAVPAVGVPHVDKLVHFLLYAVFGALLARALRREAGIATPPGGGRWTHLLATIAVVSLFGAADEWHQQWVPGRSSDVLDWCADTAGGTLALLLAARPLARPEQLT